MQIDCPECCHYGIYDRDCPDCTDGKITVYTQAEIDELKEEHQNQINEGGQKYIELQIKNTELREALEEAFKRSTNLRRILEEVNKRMDDILTKHALKSGGYKMEPNIYTETEMRKALADERKRIGDFVQMQASTYSFGTPLEAKLSSLAKAIRQMEG